MNLPMVPKRGAKVSAAMVEGIWHETRQAIAVIDDVEELDDWRLKAAALERYLRDKTLKGPMQAAQRVVEARLGELLPPEKGGRGKTCYHGNNFNTRDRVEFRILANGLNGECELEEKEWQDSRRGLVKKIRDILNLYPETPEMPKGIYGLIYADPPWRYEHVKTESRSLEENQYPTMSLEEICALKVPAADDCVLFLWATAPKLAEAMSVLRSWEFSYRTCAVWDKGKIGMGYYFRVQHELLLIGVKGEPGTPDTSVRVSSVIKSPREKHSAKPSKVYDLIEAMYPNLRKVELFSRQSRKDWDAWGNECQSTTLRKD